MRDARSAAIAGWLAPGGLCLACLVAASLAACSGLPAAGPTVSQIVDQSKQDGAGRFLIVDVDGTVLDDLARRPRETLNARFGQDGPPPQPVVAVGDTLSVTIWEAGGSLFHAAGAPGGDGASVGAEATALPPQLVQADGTIVVPFAGRIPVLGEGAIEIEDQIARSLKGKAFDPQVIVSVTPGTHYSATVTGEVVGGARIPLPPQNARILDVIASAGGAKGPTFQITVTLTRNGASATVPLATLIDQPAENIFVWPGDVLTLLQTHRTFEAFGATGKNSEIDFDHDQVSLAQGLAQASGLLDDRADAAGVFLLRLEPRALVEQFANPATLPPGAGARVPVVYHFNLDSIQSYFMAQQFTLMNNDIVYVANAEANSIQKFLTILNSATNPIITGIFTANSIRQ